MKPLKTLKAKKLQIKKETLRTLTDSDLSRAAGGQIYTYSQWCSTGIYEKCGGNGTVTGTISNACYQA